MVEKPIKPNRSFGGGSRWGSSVRILCWAVPFLYVSLCLLPEDMKSWIKVLDYASAAKGTALAVLPFFWGHGNQVSCSSFQAPKQFSDEYTSIDKTICPFHSLEKGTTHRSCCNSWLYLKVDYFRPSHPVRYCSPPRMCQLVLFLPKESRGLGRSPFAKSSLAQAMLSVKIIKLKTRFD